MWLLVGEVLGRIFDWRTSLLLVLGFQALVLTGLWLWFTKISVTRKATLKKTLFNLGLSVSVSLIFVITLVLSLSFGNISEPVGNLVFLPIYIIQLFSLGWQISEALIFPIMTILILLWWFQLLFLMFGSFYLLFKSRFSWLRLKPLLLGSLSTLGLLYVIVVGQFHLSNHCQQALSQFHVFNAHLKDVCSDEKWASECPDTLADLTNYNPESMAKMRSCSQVRYYKDSQGQGTLLVRQGNRVMVSDRRLGAERFSFFWMREVNDPYYRKTYPPEFEGRWDLIE